MKPLAAFLLCVSVLVGFSCAREIKVGPEEGRVIAEEAYLYGYPIVENYRLLYHFAVYKQSPAYKAPLNHLAIVMPDTTQPDSLRQTGILAPPYALAWLDLRKEPVVITVPPMASGETFHIQLVDLYTHNFDEIGTATTGNAGGSYLIAPVPSWSGETPDKISKVILCETQFALLLIRPAYSGDVAAADEFLNRFDVHTLDQFKGGPAKKADALIFPPYSVETAQSAGFFQYLNFALQFCPVAPSEVQVRARFAKLGIAAGKSFNVATSDPEMLKAINAGIADAKAAIDSAVANTPESAARYGTRAQLDNDYLARAVAARVRLYGPPLQ